MPLTSGNSVFTEPGSRAEIRVSATAIRLAEGSELDRRRLDDDGFEANVASGSASVRGAASRNAASASRSRHRRRCSCSTPRACTGSTTIPSSTNPASRLRADRRTSTADRGASSFRRDEASGSRAAPSPRYGLEAARRGRRLRPLGPVARLRLERRVGAPLRLAVHDRIRGPRRERPMVQRSRLRAGVDALARAIPHGRRTATGAGPTCSPGDGHGSTTRLGAMRRSTTAAGSSCGIAGHGARGGAPIARSTRLRSWDGPARARASQAPAHRAGIRSRRGSGYSPGIARLRRTSIA